MMRSLATLLVSAVALTAAMAAFSPTFASAAVVETAPQFRDFVKWFEDIGGDAKKLTLAAFKGMGTGIAAVEPVVEDDPVIRVPLDYVICRKSIQAEKPAGVGEGGKELAAAVTADDLLVSAVLVRERARGDASPWAPYIEVLPKSVPLSFTFSSAQIDMLQDPIAIRRARNRQAAVKQQIDSVRPAVVAALRAVGVDPDSVDIDEGMRWALSLVDSRALTIHGEKYLVPFADMFNYQPHSKDREAASGAHFLHYHVLSDDSFTVKADRAAAPGEQLFEDYGDNDNTLYLHHHGFVAADNPFDCVVIQLPELRKSDSLLPLKQKLAKSLRLSQYNAEACMKPGAPIPRQVEMWLHIVYMKAAALKRCKRVSGGDRSAPAIQACFSSMERQASHRRLAKAFKAQLRAFPTHLKSDEKRLKATELSEIPRLALEYRITRKRLLTALVTEHERLAVAAVQDEPSNEAKADIAASPSTASDVPDATGVSGTSVDAMVKRFNDWFEASNPPVALIEAAHVPGMRLGTIAKRDIKAEEVYLSVPLSVIMSVDSAFRSKYLGPVLKKLRRKFNNGDAFHELLFHVIFETYGLPKRGEESFFKPYLDSLPTPKEMMFPVFYSEEEMQELQGSVVKRVIEDYKKEIERKFDRLQPVFDMFPDVFDPVTFSFEHYKWAHAVLDSRAIWWSGERHLVPLLDLINCVEGPDPTRIHSTQLDTAGDNAVTLAGWDFKAGEQLYENYGQPNHIYFTYHGFSLAENTHDCVRIAVTFPADVPEAERQRRIEKLHDYRLSENYVPCFDPKNLEPRDLMFIETMYGVPRGSAIGSLKTVARKALKAYKTTIEEDEALVDKPGTSPEFQAIVKFRLSEKRLLSELTQLSSGDTASKRRRTEL